MKKRIKIIELNSGKKYYIPQRMWFTPPFKANNFITKFIWKLLYKYNILWMDNEHYDTIEEAQRILDSYAKKEHELYLQEVKQIKYTKYPNTHQ